MRVEDLDVLLDVPAEVTAFAAGPDGSLYATTPASLYRAHVERPREWSEVAATDGYVIRLVASDSGGVYAIRRGCQNLFRFDRAGGWRALAPEQLDSTWVAGHVTECQSVTDIWSSPSDPERVVAVGLRGLTLTFDGQRWVSEMASVSRDGAEEERWLRELDLWAVSGNADRLVAVGDREVLTRPAHGPGPWRSLAAEPLPGACRLYGVSALRDGVVAAGGPRPCVVRIGWDGGRSSVDTSIASGTQHLYGGRQSGEGALFWSNFGDVVEVRGGSVAATVRFDGFETVRGAAIVGGHLYAGGSAGAERGFVARIDRP